MSVEDRDFELSKYNLTLVLDFVKFADAKAGFFLTLGLAIFSVSLIDIPALARVSKASWQASNYLPLLLLTIAHCVFYTLLVMALLKLVQVVKPDLGGTKGERPSWFFFSDLAAAGDSKFAELSANEAEIKLAQLNDQIRLNSKVAVEKYAKLSNAIPQLVMASLFALFAVVPTLVADALLAP